MGGFCAFRELWLLWCFSSSTVIRILSAFLLGSQEHSDIRCWWLCSTGSRLIHASPLAGCAERLLTSGCRNSHCVPSICSTGGETKECYYGGGGNMSVERGYLSLRFEHTIYGGGRGMIFVQPLGCRNSKDLKHYIFEKRNEVRQLKNMNLPQEHTYWTRT